MSSDESVFIEVQVSNLSNQMHTVLGCQNTGSLFMLMEEDKQKAVEKL